MVVFPNLNEFVAVDTRSQLRARPIIHSLDLADIAGSDFANSLEEEFSSIVRRRETGFLGLMGIPRKVENLVRTRAIRNLLELISQDTDEQVPGEAASVGILFFTGPLLRIDRPQVRELADELFGERLSVSLLNDLSEMIVEPDGTANRGRAGDHQVIPRRAYQWSWRAVCHVVGKT